jgi:ATP-dependent helicase HrpA
MSEPAVPDRSRRGGRRRRPRARSTARPTPDLVDRRRAAVPVVSYPEDLPIAQRRDEIAAAIRDHQVVVVAGETGSGKTTQIPKICLELGRGVTGTIGHTQPRRLAARTVAARIAEELGVEVGGAVGFAVRFTDEVSDTTLVKLMTDGILLNELQRDREISAYDTIIIDEAHERSLNIDFILGYLAQLLPRRPDLKVIVTSATIDPQRFAEHFGGAPIIEVSGRTYPVEVRYRPLDWTPLSDAEDVPIARRDRASRRRGADHDQIDAIVDAVHELRREPPGDILVFLSGEREIRDAAEALRGLELADTEVLPLYARLTHAEQQKVFQPHRSRRIVLATNVAETSITVPGIRYVIDTGVARISRYSNRLKVQRLPIEPISQASANQRAGRCGRQSDGICIRLYDEADFEARPAFTEPEMLRTNLASVILQMTAIGLGDIAAFPFVDPPDRRAVNDGLRLLDELGALDATNTDGPLRLTPVGRTMARLPVDPRYARMLVEADRRGCLREVLVITSGLSVQDVRDRPAEDAAAADALHARFADPASDFVSLLSLWSHLRAQQRSLGSSAFRRMCRREHLNFLRIREWQDVHSQLRQVAGSMGMNGSNNPAPHEQVHRSLLAGLLSHIGHRDGDSREFVGARGSRFVLFPGSVLARKPPGWVMAAELVETSRLFARTAARIEPGWVEEMADHLVKRHHSEPHWSTRKGAAMVHERVTLYGLPIVEDRTVPYARVDPEHARELFIRHALVLDDWSGRHAFVAANRALLVESEDLEHRFRRTDLSADDETLFAAYDARIPASVVSARHFESWWKKARRRDPAVLELTLDELLGQDPSALREEDFPTEWTHGDLRLPLSYHFEPGTPDDGVAVHIPIEVLNQVGPAGFDRLVPGLREELVVTLLRTLPKATRQDLLPLPETAREFLARLAADEPHGPSPTAEPLTAALARFATEASGGRVAAAAFGAATLPDHLRMIFRVEGPGDAVLGQGRDLPALKRALTSAMRRALSDAVGDVERFALSRWDLDELPRVVEAPSGALVVRAYPALVDDGATVSVRVLEDRPTQARAMWAGTRRLLRLTVPLPENGVRGGLTVGQRRALGWSPYPGGLDAVFDDVVTAVLDGLLRDHGGPVWNRDDFELLREQVAASFAAQVRDLLAVTARVLAADRILERRIDVLASTPGLLPGLEDLAGQRVGLVYDGFVAVAGRDRMADVERYQKAMAHRLDRMVEAPGRDRERMAAVNRVQARYREALVAFPPGSSVDVELEQIGWGIEELRVSLFAQRLGSPVPVSEARLLRALDALGA